MSARTNGPSASPAPVRYRLLATLMRRDMGRHREQVIGEATTRNGALAIGDHLLTSRGFPPISLWDADAKVWLTRDFQGDRPNEIGRLSLTGVIRDLGRRLLAAFFGGVAVGFGGLMLAAVFTYWTGPEAWFVFGAGKLFAVVGAVWSFFSSPLLDNFKAARLREALEVERAEAAKRGCEDGRFAHPDGDR